MREVHDLGIVILSQLKILGIALRIKSKLLNVLSLPRFCIIWLLSTAPASSLETCPTLSMCPRHWPFFPWDFNTKNTFMHVRLSLKGLPSLSLDKPSSLPMVELKCLLLRLSSLIS